MNLIEAYEKITTIVSALKNGEKSPTTAKRELTALAGVVNTTIPGVAIKVPDLTELSALHNVNNAPEPEPSESFESSYESSQC